MKRKHNNFVVDTVTALLNMIKILKDENLCI